MNRLYIKILIVFLFVISHLLLSYFVHYTGKRFYEDRIIYKKVNPKVFDLGHKYLPNWHDNFMLNLVIDFLCILPIFVNWKVFSTFIDYIPVIFMIRWITTLVTILPKHKECNDSKFDISSGISGHCYDKVFSGHFAVIVLLSCIIYSYGIIKNLPLIIFYNLLVAFLIIATRAHYTIDLIVSVFVVFVIYQNKIHI